MARRGRARGAWIAAWLTAGKPDDPEIARALAKLRTQFARFVGKGGHMPEWFPQALLKTIGKPSLRNQPGQCDPNENSLTRTHVVVFQPIRSTPQERWSGTHSAKGAESSARPGPGIR